MISIFANFNIDSEERLLRMMDSFQSFSGAEIINWVINVRGKFKKDAKLFLTEQLKDKDLFIDTLESSNGWFHDSRKLLHRVKGNYVFLWIEDHININGVENFNNVIRDVKNNNIDYLMYSMHYSGENLKTLNNLNPIEEKNIIYLDYTVEKHNDRLKYIEECGYYVPVSIISLLGVFKIDLFKKIINFNDPFFKRWNKKLPFDFEKNQFDTHWLPYRCAFPRKEFFASIDDSQGSEKNPSLIDRGLYPNRVSTQLDNKNLKNLSSLKYIGCYIKIISKIRLKLIEFGNHIARKIMINKIK